MIAGWMFILFFGASARAESSLTDLQFLTPKGAFVARETFQYTPTTGTITVSGTGAKYNDTDEKKSELTTSLTYGLLDNLELGLSLPYTLSDKSNISYGPASSVNGTSETNSSSGLGDLGLQATYRIPPELVRNVLVDFELSYSPKMSSATEATATVDGNAYRGGDDTTISARVGKKFAQFSYDVNLQLEFMGATSRTLGNTSSTVNVSAHQSVDIGLAGQYMPMPSLALRAGLLRSQVNSYTRSVTGSTNPDINVDSYSVTALMFGVADEVIPNRLALEATVAQSLNADQSGNVGGVGVDVSANATVYSVGLALQF